MIGDEGFDAQEHRAPAHVLGRAVREVEAFAERGGEQIEDGVGERQAVAEGVPVERFAQRVQERRDDAAEAVPTGEARRGDAAQVPPIESQGFDGEHHHEHAERGSEVEGVRPSGVVQREVAGREHRVPAVLTDGAAAVELQPELDVPGVVAGDLAPPPTHPHRAPRDGAREGGAEGLGDESTLEACAFLRPGGVGAQRHEAPAHGIRPQIEGGRRRGGGQAGAGALDEGAPSCGGERGVGLNGVGGHGTPRVIAWSRLRRSGAAFVDFTSADRINEASVRKYSGVAATRVVGARPRGGGRAAEGRQAAIEAIMASHFMTMSSHAMAQ